MVALIKDQYLIDASVNQATSLQHGVDVPPLTLVLDLGSEGTIVLIARPNGRFEPVRRFLS